MRRPRFGSVLAAVAIATAGLIPIFASPASATNNCGPGGGSAGALTAAGGSQFPVGPGFLASLRINCHVDANVIANSIILHDAPNAVWHHGAARTLAITATQGTSTITFAAGGMTSADVSRPISYYCHTGGSFIVSITGSPATSATLSKPTKTCTPAAGAGTAVIEYTTNRVLHDANCTAGSVTLTGTANSKFASSDIGKSVTGGPFGGAGGGTGGGNASGVWRITAVGATTATLNAAAPANCTDADTVAAGVQDVVTIGGQSYNTASPFAAVWANNPMTVQLSNSSSGAGFTCTNTPTRVALGAAAAGTIPAFSAAWTNLKGSIAGSGAAVPFTVTGLSGSALTISAASCPTGISGTVGTLSIGEPDATAPVNGAPMMTLNAALNLNPSLVKTQDDCARNTVDGFQVVGMWKNPGFYGAGTTPVPVSVGQIVFPTAVVQFSGNIVPKKGATNNGDAQVTQSHYDFVFPSLPTSAAVCLTPPITGTPSNPTQLSLQFNSTTLSGDINGNAPFSQTGAGNPGDVTVRALDARFGQTFAGKYELKNGPTSVATGSTFSCTIPASAFSATNPGLACGDG